jgi:hypothetical protein
MGIKGGVRDHHVVVHGNDWVGVTKARSLRGLVCSAVHSISIRNRLAYPGPPGGVTGRFDFRLEYARDSTVPSDKPSVPSIFTALQE